MFNTKTTIALSSALILGLSGCQEGGNTSSAAASANTASFDLASYAVTPSLSQNLKDALAYMGNEERLAYDIYTNLYSHHQEMGTEIKQLTNIASKSETKHIDIVQQLVRRYNLNENNLTEVNTPIATNAITQAEMPSGEYDIPKIQELYDTLYAKGVDSKQAALEVACMVEVVDVTDLDEYIALAQADEAEDILAGFEILRNGSYNHYWAFDKGLKNSGIADGCCSLGDEYCHSEYPQNERGKGRR